MQHSSHTHQSSQTHSEKPYTELALMSAVHFIFMVGMSYLMVDTAKDIFWNMNTFYMAIWMVAPSVVTMILFMRKMYPNNKVNQLLILGSALVFVLSFVAIRNQWAVGDKQFIKSMIPHHSGAILMCEKAKIEDSEIRALCDQIRGGQRKEIDQMNAILGRLN